MMKIIFSNKCLEYSTALHPESPQRVSVIHEILKNQGYRFIEPEPAKIEDLLKVHSRDLIDKIKTGDFSDPDTPNLAGIFDYAILSAGAALMAAQISLNNENAFSLMRPPGHHASYSNLGGFCYFNNIAIASKFLLDCNKKVCIIDIDCHHGNGTQDIFLGQNDIIYISLHQSPFYPQTGKISLKNCFNFPLASLTDEEEYLSILKSALKVAKDFRPDIIGVSCGFDTYFKDPLCNIKLQKKSYFEIARMIKALNVPVYSVLEGGYSLDIGDCAYEYILGIEK